MELFGHPFSSYTWKALIALYEKAATFTFRNVEGSEAAAALAVLWPVAKFPVLNDGGRAVIEASIIVEHVDLTHPTGQRLVPEDRAAALAVRFMDRLFDHHVMASMQQVVNEYLIDRDAPDHMRIAHAKAALDRIYDWLEGRLGADGWACGEGFTLADCAAAPSLFYADWVHPIGPGRPRLGAYRKRLLVRPSVARCIEDARPYRSYFPLGAPDRD